MGKGRQKHNNDGGSMSSTLAKFYADASGVQYQVKRTIIYLLRKQKNKLVQLCKSPAMTKLRKVLEENQKPKPPAGYDNCYTTNKICRTPSVIYARCSCDPSHAQYNAFFTSTMLHLAISISKVLSSLARTP
ncbi:Hypothetical protein PHPALM_3506 [Phytophthora palmivora]|uniref:Uncharacterized protein n=1 Tax=Phytophthora palmivora TaxID=4796 RepID=A0A2P4YM88_9STRA|nr:Hypothetical protein PHPALM_3506 [Phytophthora palmivora]